MNENDLQKKMSETIDRLAKECDYYRKEAVFYKNVVKTICTIVNEKETGSVVEKKVLNSSGQKCEKCDKDVLRDSDFIIKALLN